MVVEVLGAVVLGAGGKVGVAAVDGVVVEGAVVEGVVVEGVVAVVLVEFGAGTLVPVEMSALGGSTGAFELGPK
ncbi:hypothetical protein [Oryzibacter oryziterrae]|uniref:hypothetical protein n=1 Tax=Oryzibacter oryziterrae TaxID=2766474 RepID=UPI001F1B3CC4|nr:hypothetical protein [Oryzibacter oryziterrae]